MRFLTDSTNPKRYRYSAKNWVHISDVEAVVAGLQRQLRQLHDDIPEPSDIDLTNLAKQIRQYKKKFWKRVFGEQQK